ncbi:MAG: L,D-transpeptidase [Verrucomicrobiae bacterium]|nr:L,D-transpeptidase [Verrucomicrobiae bacterium]NNJ86411.1 L,D-transpeptidase [Akkermansiaceae bacterium]
MAIDLSAFASNYANHFRLAVKMLLATAALASMVLLNSCGLGNPGSGIVISVKDQKMLLVKSGEPVKTYPVSTSKFGLGNQPGSKRTPLGRMEVAKKIGGGAPAGAVFKSRKRTGEILPPNAPGRDPIISRIIWLRGNETSNRDTFRRFIYIHGTPEEYRIGHKASYGCIRMKSRDVIDLYRQLGVGSKVHIIRRSLRNTALGHAYAAKNEAYRPAAGS